MPRAASIRAIAASNLLVSAFGVSAGSTSGAGVASCSVAGATTVDVEVSVEATGLLESA